MPAFAVKGNLIHKLMNNEYNEHVNKMPLTSYKYFYILINNSITKFVQYVTVSIKPKDKLTQL